MATDGNFQTVGNGMLLLLQSVTNGCMHVLTTAPSPPQHASAHPGALSSP
jgi:hypothetical protein